MGTYDIFKKRYAKEQTAKPASSASKKTEKVETAKPETVEAEKPSSGMRSLDYFYNHTKAPEPVKANTLESLSASVTPAAGIVHGGRGRSFGMQRPVTAEASNEPARKQTVRPEFADQGISNSRGDTQILTGEPYNLTREGQWAAKHPIAGTLMYGVSNLVGGAEGFINTGEAALRALATGEKMNPHDIHAAPIAQAFRTGAAEGFRREAEESHPRISSALGIDSDDGRYTFGEKATDFLTGVGADAVSSGISMAAGGPLSTLLMGGSAANQSLYETSNDPNTTARQAAELALANGAAEAFFEHFSVERLLNFQNPTSTAQAVRAALAQAGVEASEEMFTEIANTLSDIAIRKDYSERGREYQDYIKQGMDPNTAATNTMRSAVTQIFLAGLGGALSGGLHTGAAMYGNTIANGMDLRRDLQSGMTLEDIAESIDTSTAEGQRVQDIANDIAQREASGTRASDTDLGYLSNAIANAAEVAERNEAVEGAAAPVEGTVEGTQDVVSETTERENTARQAATQAMNDVASETAKDTGEAFRNANYYNSQRMTSGERIFNAEMAEDMASTFGEEGQKAFSALPAEEGVKAYREWAAHYNNMRFGMPIREGMSTTLSPEQISAAMRAGALDANRAYPQDTMKAVNRAVNKISVNGVNAGNTDLSGIDYKSLTPQQKLRVDYTSTFITKGLGMDVRYVKSEAVDGKYKGMNGSFQVINGRPAITLDVNAGMNRESDWTGDITDIKSMLPVISHETTHFLEQYNPKLYKELSNTVLTALQNNGTYSKGMTINSIIEAERQRLNDTIKDENGKPVQHTQDDAIHELVARACEDMLSGDKKALDAFNSLDANTKQTLWDHVKQVFDNIREFFAQMLSSYKSDSAEAKAIRQNMEEFEKIRDLWMNALDGSHAEDIGINIDTATESAAPTGPELSYRSWNASDWVQYKKEAAKELADALGVSTKTATKYINDVNSVAKMIFDDQVRLDYDSSEGRSAFVSNTEYGGSIDFSTLCKKRLLYTGTIQAIQNLLPNTALTPAEYLQIRQMMLDAGHEVTCGLCYVEGSRVKMGVYTKEFIEKYKKTNPEYVPTMAEMNTPDGQEKLRSEHPEVYDAYVYFMNHYGTLSKGEKALFASQQKPKLYTLRTEYKGEIKKKFGGAKNRASVADKNLNGGLRIQSFSDFEIVHMIDMMQVIMDMSEAGLAGQAYTKVPEFADSFGRTGLKINCSLITKGVDENGNLIFDDREGMKHERAFELRDKYSKNVGTVLVVFNQEQLRAALADDRIDYVLPFHKSQWTSEQYDAIGLPEGTIDFTNYQNDYIKGAKSKENVMPMEYWDFSKSGRENAERYLQICAEEGRTPKFARIRGENLLIDNGDGTWSLPDGPLGDGYFKLLIDFKMYDNNGKGARQMPVRPNFSMDEIRIALNDYKGGHRSFPVANDIVQEFVDNYKEQNPRAEYSTRDIEEAADSEDRPDVIRQGSDEDIQFSTRIADKNLDNRLRVNMATFFSGTGTVDFALRNIVRHEFAVENDAKIAAVYRANNGDNIYVDDVRNVNINPHRGKVEYFHASPVCKSYSNANNDMGEKPLDIETARATADAIRNLEPKVVTVENVARYRNSEAVKIIEEALEESGYDYDVKVYSATDFGGATIRQRMFIRAVKDGVLPEVDTSEHARSWYSVVEDLIPELPEAKLSNYMEERLEPSGIDIDNLDQPVFVLGGEKSGKLTYATADKPAPTLLAKSTEAKILMPDGRVLRATPRVMARIQGLPDGFDLMEKEQGITNAYKIVGNGVPVQLTQGIVGPLLEENLIRQKSEATGVQYSMRGSSEEEIEASDNNVQYSVRHEAPPTETADIYKLMRLDPDGKIRALFIDANGPSYEMGTWYNADAPDISVLDGVEDGYAYLIRDNEIVDSKKLNVKYTKGGTSVSGLPNKNAVNEASNSNARWMAVFTGKNGKRAVHNVGINGSGTVSTFAYRPGIHAGSLPSMQQIGKGPSKNIRDDRFVWVKGKIAYDAETQAEADRKGGEINDRVPEGGYRYRTNSQADDRIGWYISGAFLPERVLSDWEADEIVNEYNEENGTNIPLDHRRENGRVFNAETMQLEDGPQYSARAQELDNEYREALDAKNEDWQLMLVDQAAYEAGYTTTAYHGSPFTDINVFSTRSQDEKKQSKQLLFGTHFTQNLEYAKIYARKAKNSKGTSRMTTREGKIYKTYLDPGKSLDLRTARNITPGTEEYKLYEDAPAKYRKKYPAFTFSKYDTDQGLGSGQFITAATLENVLQAMSPKEATDFLVDHGYNSILYDASYATPASGNNRLTRDPSIIMLDPERIKSGDPVTHDDNGNVIPLSERFNSENEDIRYSQRDVDMSGTLDEFMERMDNRFLDRLADLDGEENAQLRQDLEDAYRANLEWTISEMQRRMDSAVGAEKKKAKKRLDALRARKNQRIDEVIADFREKRFRERVKRSERKAQQELLRRARRLAKKKGDPNFRAQVDALIGDLDLVAAGIRSDTRSKLEEIKKQVEAQSELDPDYAKYEAPKYADLIGRLGKKHISQMKIEDIVQLTESIVALEHSKRTADREIKEGVGRTFGHYGKVAVEQQSRIKGINYKNEIGAQLGKYKLNMLNPVRAFSLIDGYQRDGVFTYFGKQLNDGQTKAAQFRMDVEKMFQDIDNNPKLVNDFAKQNIEIDTLEGKKKISKGMRIALYLHLQNAENVKHIAFGGITIPNERLYSRGKYAEAYAAGETVHLSEWIPGAKGESVFSEINRKNDAAAAAAIRKITDQMTPEELEYAKIAEKFFNETTKNAINEVSLELNGYEKATVEHYFPISTNKNFLQSSYDGLVKDGTLEGMGMLKERSGSRLPIYLEDASQVVLRQKNNTALYYGLAVPIRNFTRFYNYTGGERLERSVKASVGKTWGKTALDYIDNVLSDLQFGRQTQRSITDTMKSIYAGTTLNLNLGVAIKQSASYPFAASVIGWGPLAKAARHVVSKADREYMDSITPWGYMRRTGFSGTEMGEVAMQRTGIDNNRTIQRVKTALDLIRQVDVRTTEVLFFACEEYVKDKYPDLEVRGGEYNRRLADIYNETLQRTQPSYDVMQRNEYLRKQNDIAKIFGAFKTQTFNMGGEVIDAWSRWRAYSEYAKKDISYVNAKKEAGKAFGNTVAATIVAQGMLVILSAAANAALHRMRDYRDEKGEVTPESVAKKILHDFGTSFAGMTMGGSEAQDFALALLGDGKWYDIDYPGLTLVNDFASAAVDFRKAASKAVETGDMKDIDNASVKMAKLIMQMFKLQGVPAQNVYNIVNAIYLWGTDVKNGEAGTFNAGEGLFGLQDTSPTKEQYAKQAIDAYKNGDIAKGDRASKRTSKDAIKKAMGGKQDDAVRFLKESGLGDTINRKLWEKAGWKSNTYDKSMK